MYKHEELEGADAQYFSDTVRQTDLSDFSKLKATKWGEIWGKLEFLRD